MLKRNITLNDERHHIGSTGPGLDCQISPPLEAHMFDCKWTKINGNNNNFTADDPDGGHYVPRKNNSVCELRFLGKLYIYLLILIMFECNLYHNIYL